MRILVVSVPAAHWDRIFFYEVALEFFYPHVISRVFSGIIFSFELVSFSKISSNHPEM